MALKGAGHPETGTDEHPILNGIRLGSGGQGTVVLDPESMTVYKQFSTLDENPARRLALNEFRCLTRFQQALADQPFVNCPEPLGLDLRNGIIRMSHCPGTRLDRFLAGPSSEASKHLDHIAEQIAIAAARYVEEFDEPYFDLGQHNMIYEPRSGRLCLIDFMTMGEVRKFFQPEHDPLCFSLGNFLGTSVYHTVRPSTWSDNPLWARVEHLTSNVLSRMSDDYALSSSMIRDVSTQVYGVWGLYGKPTRLLWYSTMGRALFRRRVGAIISHIETLGP